MYLFASESVSEGHPDKVCDQISDAVLDAALAQDPNARVACEVLVKNQLVVLSGEISTSAHFNVEDIVRAQIRAIGYDDATFSADGCHIFNTISQQSPDIAGGVDRADTKQQGAGDQGLMFGYATKESEHLMPAPIDIAHRLMRQQALLRKNGTLAWLGPDAKAQVIMRYEADGKPIAIDNVVLSTQHDESIAHSDLKEAVIETIIKPILPSEYQHDNITYHINPTGKFVIGGPAGDCGLTGRKIIVDTYGGAARHGGGAFSGKDPSKVDRSAAYALRYIAKNVVASGLATHCELQVSYAIGEYEPVSVLVNTFGTGTLSDAELLRRIRATFDLTPHGIIEMLDLLKPIYLATAAYGHFGRNEPTGFHWERTDKIEALQG